MLINGATYYASQSISGCESTDRLAVVVTTVTSPPTGNATQEFCTGGGTVTVNSLSATGSNLKWYANPTGGTFLPSNTPLVNGTTYYASQTTAACESSARLAVTVTLNALPSAPSGSGSQNACA
ncbi:MAG: gliding motility-associated C-terminal domain-containing protein, partial [Cryomorphaceae bacterium]|nr:gliding motility-associated C-terminal domain-containing protein [Cryomorphaceae bacterium]